MQEQTMQEHKGMERRDQRGFTLIELLIAIVVVGVLTAVAIVGIGGLVNQGHSAACQATEDAAKTAQAVFYANSTDNTYPQTFTAMINGGELEKPDGVTDNGTSLDGKGWTLTLTAGAATTDPSTFSGCPTNS